MSDLGKAIADRMKARKGESSDGDGADSSEPDEGSPAEESYDSVGASALADMSDALGLEGEAKDQFQSAMADYVKACMSKGDSNG